MARSNSYKHDKMDDQFKYSISYSVSLCFPYRVATVTNFTW